MLHADLTEKIIGACYKVYNTLGAGFLEAVYANALFIELQEAGLQAEREVKLDVAYRGQIVGHYHADMMVNRLVVLELKAVESLAVAHEVQLVNYLAATGCDLGLLINFGPKEVTVRRKVRQLPR